jgi:hypothetical protein
MPGFKTVPDPLVEHAEYAFAHFRSLGYTVRTEPSSILYPYSPTLVCTRERTTVIVEVLRLIHVGRAQAWAAFARSSGRDTRVAVCVPSSQAIIPQDEQALRSMGVGIYTTSATGLVERVVPIDLGLNVGLPPLDSYPARVRRSLGPAYEQFSRSQWREGFGDACQALEVAARRHLKTGCKRGRTKLVAKRGTRVPSASQIDRMTMGQLARAYADILAPNYVDKVVGEVLSKVNDDRIGAAHHKLKPAIEKRLRTNVGQNMWLIANALRELVR